MTSTKPPATPVALLAPIEIGSGTIVHIGRSNMQIPKHALIGIAVAGDQRRWLIRIAEGKDPSVALEALHIELPEGRDTHTPQDKRQSEKPPITLGAVRTR